jgi:transcriptional regulator with XRE-family HTH domain
MDNIYDFSILRELRKREGLNISDVSDRSGVSTAVISKLERNQTKAEIDTIYKLGRVFGMNASELLALAESRSAQKKSETKHDSDGFNFREIRYDNVRALYATAKAGSSVSRPRIHHDDYEMCWVLKGKLAFYLPHEKHELNAGDSIQFDALQEHSYEALEDVEIIILHIKKGKRF